MITGVILAGGKSTRTNLNKLCLNIDDKPILFWTIENIKHNVDKLIVVTGKFHEQLKKIIPDDIEIKFNKNFELGMFSSIKCGLEDIEDDVLIQLGDCPFVKDETIKKIINSEGKYLIKVPTYKGKHGHPIFIKKELVNIIRQSSNETTLKQIRDKYGFDEVEVDDKNILNDIDYLKDYENIKADFERR